MTTNYRPWEWLETVSWLREALHLIEHGHFSGGDREIFRPLVAPLVAPLVGRDPFLVLADLVDYCRAQKQVNTLWCEQVRWLERLVLNSARSGFFSSDRAIREYAEGIWGVRPLALELASGVDVAAHGRQSAFAPGPRGLLCPLAPTARSTWWPVTSSFFGSSSTAWNESSRLWPTCRRGWRVTRLPLRCSTSASIDLMGCVRRRRTSPPTGSDP